jgi:hypothetical protein
MPIETEVKMPDVTRTGFLSLPRELRDQIYRYWSNDEQYRYTNDEGTWIPFEGPEKPAQSIRVTGWKVNHILDKDYAHALLLNHQVGSEYLSAAFQDLHLVLNIEHLSINESLPPWTLASWGIPRLFIENAKEIDIRIEFIPRLSFAQGHTIEAQMKHLREHGYNSYMGEPRNSQHRTIMNMRRFQTIGKDHIQWRTPETAFENFEAMMQPVGAAVADRGMSMPETIKDDYDSDRHLQRFIFWELMSSPKHSAVFNRFQQRLEAIKKVWHVELPWGEYLQWFKDDVYSRDEEMARMLEMVLWDDFIAGLRNLVEQLTILMEAPRELKALRLHLRLQDEAIAGVKGALWEILEEVPAFMEMKSVEYISLFNKDDTLSGEYAASLEQWSSRKSVSEGTGLQAALAKYGAKESVNMRIKAGQLVSSPEV